MSDTDISEEAVRNATGRGWRRWWKVLDAWGAPQHSHAEIARFLGHEYGLSDWWGQMVTVQYERDHGMREVGEIRVVSLGSHVRLTWQPPAWSKASTLQVRVSEASSGRGTVVFHHEQLPDQDAREVMIEHWKARLSALADVWSERSSVNDA